MTTLHDSSSATSGSGVPPVVVADHELIRLIRSGNYGQVWLARSTLGVYRAVKLVHSQAFHDHRPFQREFKGVQKFEPVSRQHEGLVDVLQVGRDEQAGYFYYVMELADDVSTGTSIDPKQYVPRTLAHDIAIRKRLPVIECLEVGICIASALAFLHERGLIHRDVKPSNIIFVNGVPKLADVGLVTETAEARSYVGTAGFIPPEGPGTVPADIYSLGKVLYEMSTGKDRYDYPDLPTQMEDQEADRALLNLNEIIVAACRAEPRERYASAKDLIADMASLQLDPAGWSPRRSSRRRALIIGGAAAVVATGCALSWQFLQTGCYFRFGADPSPPVLSSVCPRFGKPGDKIAILGTNFPTDLSRALVYFGGMRARVASLTPTNLVVIQPAGATPGLVAVVNRGLTGYSPKRFLPTFSGCGAPIDSNSFAMPIETPTRNGPMHLAVADFDGDGKPDVAVAIAYDHKIAIYRDNSTNGGLDGLKLTPVLEIPFGDGRDDPLWITPADLDGDGRMDLVVTDRTKARVGVLRNRSTAARLLFAAPVYFPVGIDPRQGIACDLNGDGLPDLIVANCFPGTVSVLQNTSFPGSSRITFAPKVDLPVPWDTQDVTAGDLDGDGRPDLAVAGASDEKITVYQNLHTKGDLSVKSFGRRLDFDAPYAGHSIVMADVDGDGKPDLVLGARIGSVAVFRNQAGVGLLSTNSFAPAEIFPTDARVHQVAVGDLNGDRKPEIVVATELPTHVSVFENCSVPGTITSASLGPRLDLEAGWNCSSVAVADLNGDGRPDLVFTSAYTNALVVYKNLLR